MKRYSQDCAFNNEVIGCTALDIYKCDRADVCPFYKTPQKVLSDMRKSNARLRSLSAEKQRQIADTYYGGRMPWQD